MEQLANKQSKKKVGVKRRRKSNDEGDEKTPPSRLESESLSGAVDRIVGSRAPSISETDPITERPSMVQDPVDSDTSRASSHMAKQNDLLRYLFAPEAVADSRYGYNDLSSIWQCDAGESDLWEEMGGRVWSEPPSGAIANLDQDAINECVSGRNTHKSR